MKGSKIHAEALLALFSALVFVPGPSRANGLLGNLLKKAADTVVNRVETAAKEHPGTTARPAQEHARAPHKAGSANAPPSSTSGSAETETFHPNRAKCHNIDQTRKCLLVLKTTAHPHLTIESNVGLDILGVRPGMSFKQAETLLTGHYRSPPQIFKGQASSWHKNVFVKSHPYVVSVKYDRGTSVEDTTTVYFSSPATGHVVELVTRAIGTGQTALSANQVIAELDKKYGPQTPPAISTTTKSADPTLNWIYGKNGKVHSCGYLSTACWCPGNAEGATTAGAPAGQGPRDYSGQFSIKHGQYECVQAYLSEPYGDVTKVEALTLVVDAPVIELDDSAQAIGQLQAAALDIYKHENPATLPTL